MDPAAKAGRRKDAILVVDDDPNFRKTLADILRARAFEAVTAQSGNEAVAAAGKQTFGVALIDLRLPDMSGLEVMERIKAASPLTEAIILTGHASLDTAIEATRQGAFSYLLKPYDMDELLQNLQHALERHQAREEIQRLASYPRLNPNPIVELDRNGAVSYANPAALERFPDLAAGESLHPLLAGLPRMFAQLQGTEGEVVRELAMNGDTWEEHVSYVPESDAIRVYAFDISERKRAELALAAREQDLAAVARLGTQALAGLDLQAVHEAAAALVLRELGVECCLVLELPPGEKTALLLQAVAGWTPSQPGGTPVPLEEGGWAAQVLAAGGPLSFGDLRAHAPRALPPVVAELNPASGIAVALGAPAKPLGILAAFAGSRRDFSHDETDFLQEVANVLAAALERQRAEEEIHLLATTDSLTGAANRREFSAVLEKESDRARRYGTPLSLIMYDLDHFKRINDTYGHDSGDRVLRALTELVKSDVRSVDLVGRWGGEEFMVMTPQLDLAGARNVAEKLRAGIAQAAIPGVGTVTASFGVTAFAASDDLKALLKRVDDALYQAKAKGRNRVEVLEAAVAPSLPGATRKG